MENNFDEEEPWIFSEGEDEEEELLISSDSEEEADDDGDDDDDEEQPPEREMVKINVDEKLQPLVSSFLEVVEGQSDETAVHYLQETDWNVEEAVKLFYSVDYRGSIWAQSMLVAEDDDLDRVAAQEGQDDNLAPVAQDDNLAPVAQVDNLASLYRPPLELMFEGTFEEAKVFAANEDKWLIVNVQSETEFSSKTLNLDTWAHEAVSQTIGADFIFWQVYNHVTEGQKVCTYYHLTSFPAVLVLDPITGKKMKLWPPGMVEATQFLEDLVPFMDAGPQHQYPQLFRKLPTETSQTTEKEDAPTHVAPTSTDTDEVVIDEPVTSSSSKKLTYPELPEEPKVDKTLLCRIGVRLPDGRRLQRNFLRTDPLQLLWSFCSSQLDEAESRSFKLTTAIPGASKTLDYESNQTFEESGLSNTMVFFTWD